jgi:tRNA(adenine34) deaminase
VTPHDMVGLAIAVADDGAAAGELPIGAVVVMGDQVVGQACTQEKSQGRRLVHADLLAMEEADRRLGRRSRPAPLVLAVNLEPCLMCLGAAMSLEVERIYYGLASASDGAAGVAAVWRPRRGDMPFSRVPELLGGLRADEVRAQFSRYADTAASPALRRWAADLSRLPEEETPSVDARDRRR